MSRKRIAIWNLQVPKALNEALTEALILDFHMTKAEFIREAVREKLAKQLPTRFQGPKESREKLPLPCIPQIPLEGGDIVGRESSTE